MIIVWKLLALPSVASAFELSAQDRELICDGTKHPYPPHKQSAIRWLHVPKTGTSFANAVWHYGCNIDANVSVADWDTRYEGNLHDKYPLEHWCPNLVDHTPSTHKPIGKKEWANHKGRFVTMVREPSSRMLSAYNFGNHHCISDCNPENSETHFECESGVRDLRRGGSERCVQLHGSHCPGHYAAALPAQGCQTKMILGYPCAANVSLTQTDLDEAVARVKSGFSFVGLFEEWDLSLCLFHRILGSEFNQVEKAHVRRGSSQVPEDCPKDEQIADELDQPLYSAAKSIFHKRVRQVLLELKGDVQNAMHLTLLQDRGEASPNTTAVLPERTREAGPTTKAVLLEVRGEADRNNTSVSPETLGDAHPDASAAAPTATSEANTKTATVSQEVERQASPNATVAMYEAKGETSLKSMAVLQEMHGQTGLNATAVSRERKAEVSRNKTAVLLQMLGDASRGGMVNPFAKMRKVRRHA